MEDLWTGASGTHLDVHTPDIGGAWVPLTSGIYELNGSGALEKTSFNGAPSLTPNAALPPSLPYTMDFSWIYNGSAVGTPQIGWAWCLADANNYVVCFYDLASGTIYAYTLIGGTFTLIASAFHSIVAAGGTIAGTATIDAVNAQFDFPGISYTIGPFAHGLNGLDAISPFFQGTPGGIGTDIALGPIDCNA